MNETRCIGAFPDIGVSVSNQLFSPTNKGNKCDISGADERAAYKILLRIGFYVQRQRETLLMISLVSAVFAGEGDDAPTAPATVVSQIRLASRPCCGRRRRGRTRPSHRRAAQALFALSALWRCISHARVGYVAASARRWPFCRRNSRLMTRKVRWKEEEGIHRRRRSFTSTYKTPTPLITLLSFPLFPFRFLGCQRNNQWRKRIRSWTHCRRNERAERDQHDDAVVAPPVGSPTKAGGDGSRERRCVHVFLALVSSGPSVRPFSTPPPSSSSSSWRRRARRRCLRALRAWRASVVELPSSVVRVTCEGKGRPTDLPSTCRACSRPR
jgi:hypothetical protein